MDQEVFIPLKINTRKGRAATIVKPKDYYANTPLARLLAKAYILENQLIKSAESGITLTEFCKINKISRRYVREIIAFNNLSPKIKQCIMKGETPKHIGVEKIKNYGILLIWREQERWLCIKHD